MSALQKKICIHSKKIQIYWEGWVDGKFTFINWRCTFKIYWFNIQLIWWENVDLYVCFNFILWNLLNWQTLFPSSCMQCVATQPHFKSTHAYSLLFPFTLRNHTLSPITICTVSIHSLYLLSVHTVPFI